MIKRLSVVISVLTLISLISACDGLRRSTTWKEIIEEPGNSTLTISRRVWFDPAWGSSYRQSPYIYQISFTDPSTSDEVTWKGRKGEAPVSIQLLESAPVLIVMVSGINVKKWGCPEVPYIAVRYENSSRTWAKTDLSKIPETNRKANLSPRYDGYFMGAYQTLTDEWIQRRLNSNSRESSGYFQPDIPTQQDAWRYQYKDDYSQRCRGLHEEDEFTLSSFIALIFKSPLFFGVFAPLLALPLRLSVMMFVKVRTGTTKAALILYLAAFLVEGISFFLIWALGWGLAAGFLALPIAAISYLLLIPALILDFNRVMVSTTNH